VIDQTLNCRYLFSAYLNVDQFSFLIYFFLLVFVLGYFKTFERNKLSDAGLLLFVIGGILNTFERFSTGCVRDYLNFFDLVKFNVYDIIVTVGVVILASRQLFSYGEKSTDSRR
jgi:lipoprotein signal peptidase